MSLTCCSDGSMDDELNGEEERMEVEVGGETEVERRTRMERETREMYSSNKEQLIHRLKTLMDRGRWGIRKMLQMLQYMCTT